MKTYSQKQSEVSREWQLVDAKSQILGRLATQIAGKLIGKDKPSYTPNIDAGDYVVVTNAAQIELTRNKAQKKVYRWHTGFVGGLKEMGFEEMMKRFPERVIEKAVYNMLPKNRLRQHRMNRLKVYAGAEHKHESQLGKKHQAPSNK
ncbi:MAG: 50S ribosomal protein L13 [Patescibacteria group bacterium]